MDAKHIWRAALGELQVALSPANFETWLRHTSLVDVDDTRFRIAVPNGFRANGSPAGVMFTGHLYREGDIIALAAAWQDASASVPHPPLFAVTG